MEEVPSEFYANCPVCTFIHSTDAWEAGSRHTHNITQAENRTLSLLSIFLVKLKTWHWDKGRRAKLQKIAIWVVRLNVANVAERYWHAQLGIMDSEGTIRQNRTNRRWFNLIRRFLLVHEPEEASRLKAMQVNPLHLLVKSKFATVHKCVTKKWKQHLMHFKPLGDKHRQKLHVHVSLSLFLTDRSSFEGQFLKWITMTISLCYAWKAWTANVKKTAVIDSNFGHQAVMKCWIAGIVFLLCRYHEEYFLPACVCGNFC